MKFIYLGLLLFLSNLVYGQQGYVPGYIINLQGDTVQGLINSRNLAKKSILFKTSSESKKVEFSPMQVKGFSVYDQVYLSAIVDTEVSPTNTNELLFYAPLNIRVDTTFLKTIIRGSKSLYFYNNAVGNNQFYIQENNKFELLIYKMYKRNLGGQTDVIEVKKFINQLQMYLDNCPDVQSKLQDLEYTERALRKLFLLYFECTGSTITFQRKVEKTKLEFGLLAGISSTTIKFVGNDYPYLTSPTYERSNNFTVGIFFDFIIPKNQGRWSSYNEFTFAGYNFSGTYRVNSVSTINTTIAYSYFKINNLIRYRIPLKGTSIFFNAGISNGLALSETNEKKSNGSSFGSAYSFGNKAVDNSRTYEQSLLMGIGIRVKILSFEFRYEIGNGISQNSALQSQTNRLYFLVGIKL